MLYIIAESVRRRRVLEGWADRQKLPRIRRMSCTYQPADAAIPRGYRLKVGDLLLSNTVPHWNQLPMGFLHGVRLVLISDGGDREPWLYKVMPSRPPMPTDPVELAQWLIEQGELLG